MLCKMPICTYTVHWMKREKNVKPTFRRLLGGSIISEQKYIRVMMTQQTIVKVTRTREMIVNKPEEINARRLEWTVFRTTKRKEERELFRARKSPQ